MAPQDNLNSVFIKMYGQLYWQDKLMVAIFFKIIYILHHGRENTSIFWAEVLVLDQKSNGQNSPQDKAPWVNCPHASFIYIQSGRRDATQSTSSADSEGWFVAARQSWVAPGLRSSGFAVAGTYFCTVWDDMIEIPHQINRRSVFEPHMHRISLEIGLNKRRGGEAVELSNQ